MELNKELIEEIVRKVASELQLGGLNFKETDPSGITVVHKDKLGEFDKFDTGKPNDEVYIKDLFDTKESPRLAAGYMKMCHSRFQWTLNYDEMDYVIDGTLEIIVNGKKLSGSKGDCIFIPMGSTIEFSAPEYAEFFYVTYPANWSELG